MNKILTCGAAGAGLCALLTLAQPARAAPPPVAESSADPATQTRSVDARVVRVRLDGLVSLTIRQGTPASITLNGDPRQQARTSTVQKGDTLYIDAQGHNRMTSQGVHAELVLPALREVTSESLGSTEISGFSGDELALTLDGAGAMVVTSSYRLLKASLGGIGSMQLQNLNCERVELTLQGAGYMMLRGRARMLKADLGGVGNLDAQGFSADTVDIDLSGLGNASITARQSANLNLSGMGSVTVYGKPANRKVAVDGLGKVSWK
jgi:hypothetical protein